MTIIKELNARGLLYGMTDDALEQKLETEKTTFYLGIDPSADSMHIGHLIPLIVARKLSDHGHQPIIVIGGGTGLIGDPSGKSEERNLITLEETMNNSEKLANQVKKILPQSIIVNNYDWLKTYDMITFLRDIGKHFSINAMLAKDSVKNRLETGISFTEFTYQIIQSLDFLELYRSHNCILQIGGQEQWGNITAGLELIRRVLGSEEKAYGLVIPLITKEDGTKFGKTAAGAVWVDANKTSPYEFYQYWINLDDATAIGRLKQYSAKSLDELAEVERLMKETPHLRHAQKALAEELTAMIHGPEAMNQVNNISQALFYGEVSNLTKEEIEMGFKDVSSITVDASINLIDALLDLELASSKREARTFIKNNAVAVNGDKVNEESFVIQKDCALHQSFTILKRGKKLYGVIKHRA